MANDSSLFSLYLNQRYGINYRQKKLHYRSFENYNNWSQNEIQIKTLFRCYPDKSCDEIENERNRKCSRQKKREYKVYERPVSLNLIITSSDHINSNTLNKKNGLPTLKQSKNMKLIVRGSEIMTKKACSKKYTVNVISEYNVPCGNSDPFHNPLLQTKIKIYRCQLSTKEESCCCSCNSDAMFEVMKSLYDCYKKKDCDHCNCILCGHLPREERRLGEVRKSAATMKTASAKEKAKAAKVALAEMQGKSPAEKEKILKDLAMKNVPLPKGRTPSEIELIKKVRTEAGLPPEPETAVEEQKYKKAEAKDIITQLEGKSQAEKEKILKRHAKLGLPLPEGRSPSEKALIQKIQTAVRMPDVKISSEKVSKTKAAALLPPLEGKSREEKEKILRGLAQQGIPLPEGKTPTERKLIEKLRKDLGLPSEPKTPPAKEKYSKALAAGLITPLEGKTPAQKKKILQGLADLGLPLPEGHTPSEKAMIAEAAAGATSVMPISSEMLRKAKAAGLITPLKGKSLDEKKKILKGLAEHGIPLPKGKSTSEKQLIDSVRKDMGLPPEPKTPLEKENYKKALAAGLLIPLEGKSIAQKEKILQGQADLGLTLPEGRTASEKALIAKVKGSARAPSVMPIPSKKLRKSKAAGLITPLTQKTPEQKEKILRGLAANGIPLPEGKTPSEKKIIDKVRKDMGLPPEPKTTSSKEKYNKAIAAGLITPLNGKTNAQKEKILKGLANLGVPLPDGRTPSEKAMIAQVKAEPSTAIDFPSLPPAQRKKLDEKTAKVMKEGKGPSDECICPQLTPKADRVSKLAQISTEPHKIASEKLKAAKAAGLITPLEGKSAAQKEKILRGQANLGLPLPEGRTSSEKLLIAKVKATTKPPSVVSIPSGKLRKAKAAGLITPLKGKTPEQREKILKGLAVHGIPLPESTTSSERKLIDKVRKDMGLPPEPKSMSDKEKYKRATAAGLITPLEGKSTAQKQKILRGQADLGLPLPEGRTPSEKSLIAKLAATARPPSVIPVPSEKLRKAKAAGLITPLKGKTTKQKEKILRGLAEHGIPLPESTTSSERKLIDKVRKDMGLPPEPKSMSDKEKYKRATAAGLITPLEGKSTAQKQKILRGQADLGLPLPVGRTPSEKSLIAKLAATARPPSIVPVPSEKLRKAKAAGLITPLKGKTPEQKEKILRGLAEHGISLPESTTSSERKLIDKVRKDMGLPPEPKSMPDKEKYRRATAAGLITPLEGKSTAQKQKILRGQADLGLPLPVGRTPSEKSLIAKLAATARPPSVVPVPSEKLRKAKAAGLITPLKGKTPEQKEKILRGLAEHGIPLPESTTSSERKLIDKVRKDMGLPPEPKSMSDKEKYKRATAAGLITPLEGKSTAQKQKILRGQADLGLPLPVGRTPSEKSLIAKLAATARPPSVVPVPSEKLRKAKAAGLITPLKGKTPEQKEKILRGLTEHGIPLPESTTSSERQLIDKVRKDMGLPPEPKSMSDKEKYKRATAAGLITPLEGKSTAQKQKILRGQADLGLPLPVGRTPSEKSLIAKLAATARPPSVVPVPSEKLRKAKAAGLITPLRGKTPEQKEKILKGLVEHGLPLPEPTSQSEKKLFDKVRAESKPTPSKKMRQSKVSGLLTPLKGKTHEEKEKIVRNLIKSGLPLPEPKTSSEKSLIAKIQSEVEAKPQQQKDKVSPSVKKLDLKTAKVMKEGKGPSDECICSLLTSESERGVKKEKAKPSGISLEKLQKAKAAGLLTPLKGKSPEQKEKILRGLAQKGVLLPEPKTASEAKLMDKVRKDLGLPLRPKISSAKEKYDKALAAGLITPLEGKTLAQKEKILKKQAEMGLPLPEGRTTSEKALIDKIKATTSKLPSGKLSVIPSEKLRKAKAAGLLSPLEGKSPKQKEKQLRELAGKGLPLPEGKTPSEKSLIHKIKTELGIPPSAKTYSKKEEKFGKIKTKSKQAGAMPSRKSVKTVSVRARPPPPGVTQEFEDIVRTTTCDRGCGCDKKKIRFKHSYVKIKVTSPDISSLCPCPEECIPGVKGGIFTNNEGINITVGRALGVPSLPSYSNESNPKLKQKEVNSEKTLKCIYLNTQAVSVANRDTLSDTGESTITIYANFHSDAVKIEKKYLHGCAIRSTSESDESLPLHYFYNEHKKDYSHIDNCDSHNNLDNMNTCCYGTENNHNSAGFSVDSYAASIFSQTFRVNSYLALSSTTSSFESILLVKTESSLSLTTNPYCNESTTISVISFKDSNFSSNVSQYVASAHSANIDFDIYNDSITETQNYSIDNDYNTESKKSENYGFCTCSIENYHAHSNVYRKHYLNREFIKSASSESSLDIIEVSKLKHKDSSIVIVSNINRDEDIIEIVNKIVDEEKLGNGSSIYIVVTCSDHDAESIIDSESTICLQLSNVCHEYNNKIGPINKQPMKQKCPYGLKFNYERKDKRVEVKTPKTEEKPKKCEIVLKSIDCGTNEESPKVDIDLVTVERAKCSVGMDTTEDRPCCCCPNQEDKMHINETDTPCISSALSDLIIPMMTKESEAQGFRKGIIKGNISKCHPSYTKSVVLNTPPVPVKVCNVPPCKNPQVTIRARMISQSTTCLPEDLVNLNEEMRKEQVSVCADRKETKCGGGVPCPKKQNVKEDMCAGQCSHVKINDGRTVRCQCGGKEKKVKLKRLCPCDVYTKEIKPPGATPCGACGGLPGEMEGENITKKPCMCDQKKPVKTKSKKNTICECPPPLEPEAQPQSQAESVDQNENDFEHYNDFEWVDVKETKKMKSDLTQTTSGFTVNIVRRPPVQEEISFEEALEYFGVQKPPLTTPLERDEGCSCDDPVADTGPPPPTLPSGFDCLCPGEESSAADPNQNPAVLGQYGVEGQESEAGEWPLKGIRLTIDGKGSGSPGLAGICCFEMIQEALAKSV